MTHGATHDAAKHVATAFVRRQHTVGDEECGRAQMVGNDTVAGAMFADGHDAVYLVAQENYPAEFVDISYPMRVRSYGINPDKR